MHKHDKGRRGKHGPGLEEVVREPEAQVLFVGSPNCLRHKPFHEVGTLMQADKASLLFPSMTDFSSGRYLSQLEDAISELADEREATRFEIYFGCQWIILSTDETLIEERFLAERGITLNFHDNSHLEHGDK